MFDDAGCRDLTRVYEIADVRFLPAVAEREAEAEDAGGARKAAEQAPREDRDRWSEFDHAETRRQQQAPLPTPAAEPPPKGEPTETQAGRG